MREIKFRAWDEKFHKWLHPYPEGFHVIGEVTAFDLIGMQLKESTPELTTLERIGDVRLVQFACILDKNGKDIYEFDLLSDEDGHTGIVQWCELQGVAGFEIEWDDGDHCLIFDDAAHCDIEVIGNIFENPELLQP
jgi:uncharacterized phage protein (TIGR01671 family)